ncbi:MAG: ATP-grasp domain-containing protein [Candidatus Methanoperedens sp.]|nr:ATP-grasp domain-containing protein [Candidatus Methanoperedens sp.]
MRVLVIGNSTRSIVCSAKKAGHTVYSLDNFCDIDTLKCADKTASIEGLSDEKIYERAHLFGDVDAVILGPGFTKLKFNNILNNLPDVQEKVNDKLEIAEKFHKLDIPHPPTEPLTKASALDFPLMIKPRSGSGGMKNILVNTENQLADYANRSDADEYIAQEFVEGIPFSASLIGNGDEAVVVALNEQLIGISWLTCLPFAYCGNITPFSTRLDNEIRDFAERIALEFRLLGSNGVDFMLTDRGVVAIEVNPRFQGSLDTVELSMGINIFDAHIRSFSGEMPQLKEPVCFAAKTIEYAKNNLKINKKIEKHLRIFMDRGEAADIPKLGRIIFPDEPIATFIGTGKTREIALGNAGRSALYLRYMTEV